jgi:hypothetical protein
MSKLKDVIHWKTVSGEELAVGDVSLTPQSQALTIRWPNGGFVWNRPVAVLVERGGRTERIPIADVTRIAQLTLLGLGISFAVVSLMLSIRRRRDRNE